MQIADVTANQVGAAGAGQPMREQLKFTEEDPDLRSEEGQIEEINV